MKTARLLLALALVVTVSAACDLDPSTIAPAKPAATDPAAAARALRHEPIQPLPHPEVQDQRLVDLGRRLFHEPRLSANGNLSCASCHDLSMAGTDSRARKSSPEGDVFDTPTVINAGLNSRLFWNGRAKTLEQQVDGPLLGAGEMGATWPQVLEWLQAQPTYRDDLSALFPKGVTADGVRRAIAAYERTLVAVDSPFDRYLRGEQGALSAEAHAGYKLFKSYGCTSCHQGANVGGTMEQRMGAARSYFEGRPLKPRDLGRAAVTGREEDRHMFRVPSLRLAVLTAPYFHDGSVESLDQAIALMGQYQLGVDIPPADRKALATFIGSLAGQWVEKGK